MNNKNCFDFLRFFFAINILLCHLAELSQNKSLFFLYNWTNASYGVKGFFVISGFLVAKSYVNTVSLKKYFIKRAKRILPAYIVVILLATVFLAFFSVFIPSNYFSDIGLYKYLGWNFIFLNFMHPCLPGLFDSNLMCDVNGALWTIKVEEGFYLILPLIFYAIKKIKKAFVVLGCLYLFSILYWFVMDCYFNNPLLAKQLPGYLSYFVIGILLFLKFDYVMLYKKKFFAWSILFVILAYFIRFKIELFYPAAFGTIVIISAYNFPFFNNFGKYGDFTYGIYIYHFPIIQVFRHSNLFEKYNPILMGCCVILITFLCAIFSWFAIEKRFLDRYKKDYKPVLA
ncbi:acyltransferase family protein [Flavobacterium faecale]|uniref:acyltransferase family protein n=1 Tax=Flavobacterium faecale TaxID=1355330 RepID=UPI003AAEFE5F